MTLNKKQEAVLSVRDLSIAFEGTWLVENVNFEIYPSTVTSIVGPSGAGKTTLLRSLNRLLDEEKGFQIRGSVLLDREDIRTNNVNLYALRRRVGLVFQKPAIFPISIEKNVLFGVKHLKLANRKEFPEILERYLRKVFLWDEVKDRLGKSALGLSVGQQQRLAIARTLAVDPKIILMDEPTSALDARAADKIEDLILSLREEHSIILVTHQQQQANRLSDWLLCLGTDRGCGRLVYSGKPKDYLNDN